MLSTHQAGTPRCPCPLSCWKDPHRRRGVCRAEGLQGSCRHHGSLTCSRVGEGTVPGSHEGKQTQLPKEHFLIFKMIWKAPYPAKWTKQMMQCLPDLSDQVYFRRSGQWWCGHRSDPDWPPPATFSWGLSYGSLLTGASAHEPNARPLSSPQAWLQQTSNAKAQTCDFECKGNLLFFFVLHEDTIQKGSCWFWFMYSPLKGFFHYKSKFWNQ